MKKILIAVPCMDQCSIEFAVSLGMMNRPKNYDIKIAAIKGSLIYHSREKLAKAAIQGEYDYVVWFDSDMQIPPNAIEKLIADVDSGKDIVSGIYFRRSAPFSPVLFEKCDIEDNRPITRDLEKYEKDTTFEVEGIGFGCCAMKTEVLWNVFAENKTCFTPLVGLGEDLSFSYRARKLGYKIYCDASIKCGHVGHILIDEGMYQSLEGSKQ